MSTFLHQAYGIQLTEKRMSLETVLGIYTEDPLQKRTSIDVQFGPVGKIGVFAHGSHLPRHLGPRPSIAPKMSPAIEEEEEEEPGEGDLHGVSNPAFINDEKREDGRELSTSNGDMRTVL